MGQVVSLRSAVALLGRFPALAGVDLDVAAGEVLLVEGPNGAGKTSLLRVIAGLLPLTAGTGSVLGADLARRRRPRGIGFLGHSAGLYEDLSAEENVAFHLRSRRLDPRGATSALESVGLGPAQASTPAGRLSAGQRRRVALAALAASKPAVWLLDEPHAGLDTDSRDRLDSLISSAAVDGAAIVLASHELELVGRLATRRVRIESGRLDGRLPDPQPEAQPEPFVGAPEPLDEAAEQVRLEDPVAG
jgi:heme ABC exporter ATP-binding subunit CcmA